jgi:hypothetical protein
VTRLSSSSFALVALAAFTLAGCGFDADLSPSHVRADGSVPVRETLPSAADAGAADAGEADGAIADAAVDAGPVMPSLSFASPMDGADVPRDGVLGHEWAAVIPLRVDATGVVSVEYWAEDSVRLGEATSAPWELVARFRGEGPRSVVARGLDADGVELVRDEVSFTITPPSTPDCHSMLDALGLNWAPADAARGVTDPVRVQPVIAGVGFRYYYDDAPRALFMDCALAPRLHELAQLVRAYGYDEIVHIGIYNYRCIGGGDPDVDGCRASQHAFAHAIDIAGIGMADGSVYDSLETDWVITEGPTCPGSPITDADRELHELACAMFEDRVFEIVLTPNYNSAHRNHFHVDMTEGSMFIGESVHGVDSPFAISDD